MKIISAKCAVKDCSNHQNQGLFIGLLCSPCHAFISGVGGVYSQAYRNAAAYRHQPLNHEQRFDLLQEFKKHKSEWNAESLLIDMVEAAHKT